MPNIVLLDSGTLPGIHFNFNFHHNLTEYDNCPAELVSDALRDNEIAITNKVKITSEICQNNPQLKLIAVAATGYNNVDMDAARTAGICVCNVPGYSTDSVAEHTMLLILALMRQLPHYQRLIAAGAWQHSPYFNVMDRPLLDVSGKTLGIIGRGNIGKAVAQRAAAFGMQVVFAEHKFASRVRDGYLPFTNVLEIADVLSLHCPLNDETQALIGETEIARMKQQAMLINVSRGGIVQEQALVNALKAGHLGGAALDVCSNEPPAPDNPLLIVGLPNFILTPHVAWTGDRALSHLQQILTDNINAFVAGNPINVVS